MFTFFRIAAILIVLFIGFLCRLLAVDNFMCDMIKAAYSYHCKAGTDCGKELNISENYSAMMLHFWRPLRSFYKGTNVLEAYDKMYAKENDH